jgi:hypothetical protein
MHGSCAIAQAASASPLHEQLVVFRHVWGDGWPCAQHHHLHSHSIRGSIGSPSTTKQSEPCACSTVCFGLARGCTEAGEEPQSAKQLVSNCRHIAARPMAQY